MDRPREPISENEAALRDRLSRLSAASLRINESLDVDVALHAVMDSARSLTNAPYAAIITLDDSGAVDDHLVLGFDAGDAERLWQAPDGPRLFEYLNALPGPLRIGHLEKLTGSIGLGEFRSPVKLTAFMATPILHQGARSGHIYVGHGEPGREFTQEDEETLMMFASQAALVIANARRHRDEQRARAGLETIIETSPVGVVVFDVKTWTPATFNPEARRIVDGLRDPGQTPYDLLGLLTVRRADGSEVSLQEFPIARMLGSSETVRAAEIVMGVPDGRSVTVLLNATPVRSEEGEIESVVVTMQDMTPLEEQERLRAEFLGMVSHELRTPLAAVKGSVATVLESPNDLDPSVVRQFFHIIGDQTDHMHRLVSDLLDVARIETGTLTVSPEPAEVTALVSRARTAFTSAGGRNRLDIDLAPDLPMVMADRRHIVQVLGNLLSNAARHSPGSSVIRVNAVEDGVLVAFSVADEGRGIPAERLPHLFRKFSGGQSGEQREDTGLGLAICKGIVEAHGGRIWAASNGPGLGARFTFTLPTVGDAGSAIRSGRSQAPARSPQRERGATGEQVRVLAVDEDPQDLRYIRDTLIHSGYAPTVTGDPGEALRLVDEERPHLVLLDIILPGIDGIELMKDILDLADVPVIFLSAYGRDELIARALNMGAVDYVAKPFSPTELSARIAAALRRREAPEPLGPYVLGDLTIDYAERGVAVAGRPVHLLPMEYRLLTELSASAGRVLTYEYLLDRVWGERGGGDLRPMRTVVKKLRRKLGDDASNPTYIFTEPRVGYRMRKGSHGRWNERRKEV